MCSRIKEATLHMKREALASSFLNGLLPRALDRLMFLRNPNRISFKGHLLEPEPNVRDFLNARKLG